MSRSLNNPPASPSIFLHRWQTTHIVELTHDQFAIAPAPCHTHHIENPDDGGFNQVGEGARERVQRSQLGHHDHEVLNEVDVGGRRRDEVLV